MVNRYSLLRRGARDVIIVDAAASVEGRIADLCALRRMLLREKVPSGAVATLCGVRSSGLESLFRETQTMIIKALQRTLSLRIE